MSREDLSKIAFIVPYPFIPPKNGGHHAAFGFCDFLSRDTDLVCISTTNNEGTELFRLEKLFQDVVTKYINPIVIYRIFKYLKKNRVNWCIAHQPFIILFLQPFTKYLHTRFAIYVQNIEYQRFRSLNKLYWPLLYLIERFAYQHADRLLFISPDDQKDAIALFKLNSIKCTVVNYGTYLTKPPEDKQQIRDTIVNKLNLDPQCKIMLFFGPQTYAPNFAAVNIIRDQLYPILASKAPFPYEILICGGGMPAAQIRLFETYANLHYLGFVEDIDNYVTAADMMLNPILAGGGVKTKIIESIAAGTSVISFQTGATGMDFSVTGDKLMTVADHDIEAFVDSIIAVGQSGYVPTPQAFYDTYFWGNTIRPALALLEVGA
jgi:polysaccharide biosynthesis protein PslH